MKKISVKYFYQTLKLKIKVFDKVLEEVPEIRYSGDPVLCGVSKEVSLKEGLFVAKKLEKVLLKYRNITGMGRGLAAPQIGINKAVFITYLNGKIQIFINPKIIKKSKKQNLYRELCVSIGIFFADVKRAEWVVLSFVDEKGVLQKKKFVGFEARLIQHEEAHLRGILNIKEKKLNDLGFITFDPLKEKLR